MQLKERSQKSTIANDEIYAGEFWNDSLMSGEEPLISHHDVFSASGGGSCNSTACGPTCSGSCSASCDGKCSPSGRCPK